MSAKSTLIAAAVMLAMAPLHAGAHMILKSPVPYGNPNNFGIVTAFESTAFKQGKFW